VTPSAPDEGSMVPKRALRVASALGLYAEEFDAGTGRHLGNFPQGSRTWR
jgi:alpha,alpha-trehalase